VGAVLLYLRNGIANLLVPIYIDSTRKQGKIPEIPLGNAKKAPKELFPPFLGSLADLPPIVFTIWCITTLKPL
jgi:hypothetical protein